MLVLGGILCFLMAAALVYFALRPKLAFHLDEGWKFRGETEPSEAYIAVNGVGRLIAAVVAVVIGIACIGQYFGDKRDERAKQEQTDLYAVAEQRCESEVKPRFDEAIKWDNGKIANPDELHALAQALDVEIEIKPSSAPGPNRTSVQTSNMFVRDPALPKYHDMLLYYSGLPSHLGPRFEPVECSLAPPL
ncbi:DUF6199 family natural product biosynthesis protein [Mycolicibacterium sp. HK-90]|uniref:DUF6199 family natural product biosynthesis protein n=1 Tax=Mycolicibacterium sp. HK-90 TaxID=3056937 RepID=UPI0026588610|nr:DUF6199 family natural product biosynthesis protein [Mycolicibacterium sp. HK-90]WKG02084.1 hypothetical protein QU592_23065 [Mycolicibacterium sp. HK-90]